MISGCATYRAGVALPSTDTPLDAVHALQEGHGRTAWISLSDPSTEECQRLAHIVGLPRAATEVLEVERVRASYAEVDGWVVLSAGVARYDPDRDLVDIGGLTVVMNETVMLSVTRHAAPYIRDLRLTLQQSGADLIHGPAGILRAHMEAIVVGYAGVLRDLRDDVEKLEREVFSEDVPEGATRRIYLLKREAVDFQQASAALIDPLEDLDETQSEVLSGIPAGEWAMLRDRLVRLVDRAQSVGELLGGVLTAYQTDVALRQNEDMRKISAWVAIAAVPTMLAGIYGMNFDSMPELRYQYGYPILLGVMAVSCLVLYRVFRSRNWL